MAPTGQTAVHGESAHCMHRRGSKCEASTGLPAAPGAVDSGGKPSIPAFGESTYITPSVVTVWRSTQVRVYPVSSGTLFSSLHAATHSPQPMHAAVSTTNVHCLLAGS